MSARSKHHNKYLNNIPFVGKDDTQKSSSTDQELDFEGVDGRVVRSSELELDQIDNVQWRGYKKDLHNGVVQWNKGCQQVDITSTKDNSIEQLRFEGDSCKRIRGKNFLSIYTQLEEKWLQPRHVSRTMIHIYILWRQLCSDCIHLQLSPYRAC